MAEDGKLYITITNKAIEDDGAGVDSEEDKKEKASPLSKYIKHQFFHLIEDTAKKSVNFAVSNIGNLTGDYISQNHVNDMLDFANSLKSIGIGAYAGFKVTKGSPIGLAIGMTIGAGSFVLSNVFQDINGRINTQKTNYSIAQIRARAGMNSTNDGSRGTEN